VDVEMLGAEGSGELAEVLSYRRPKKRRGHGGVGGLGAEAEGEEGEGRKRGRFWEGEEVNLWDVTKVA
jgi:hypothetical protein